MKYDFIITPCPAPRMTRSDKWRQPTHPDPSKRRRECVAKYFKFREEFIWLCKQQRFQLKDTLEIIFYLPMPDSWSKKKKTEMFMKPHQQRPDCDNMIKSVCDSFGIDDGFVWHINAKKFWHTEGRIIIIENNCK